MNTIQRKPPVNPLSAHLLQIARQLERGDLKGISQSTIAEHVLTTREGREAFVRELKETAESHEIKRREGGD